jgi:hypothetical protein
MSRYQRYGYVVVICLHDHRAYPAGLADQSNLGFFFDATKAHEQVDAIVGLYSGEHSTGQLAVDTTIKPNQSNRFQIIREVLIEYPDARNVKIFIERWPVWVGKE